jgi:GH25 family lysozyme M1 (1,4-beta-N-acetylmuramidase)
MPIRLISPVGIPSTLAPDGFWVGADEYRIVVPALWRSVNDYGHYYPLTSIKNADGSYTYSNYAYHTGADLNLTLPGNYDADAHSPVIALAGGVVTDASRFPDPSTWGNLVVVRSQLADGTKFWTRYAHMDALHVTAGDIIEQGASLGLVGNSFGRFPYHLHVDISTSGKLDTKPGDWPGLDLTRLHTDYVDPLKFLREHVNDLSEVPMPPIMPPVNPVPPVTRSTATRIVITTNGASLNIRSGQSTNFPVIGSIPMGATVLIYTDNIARGFAQLADRLGYASTTYLGDPPIVTDTIIDLSNNNVIADPVTFKAEIAAGRITVIMHRATMGDGSDQWIDGAFLARQAEYGPLCTFIPYHVLNADDPIKQADNFVSVAKPAGVPLMVDVETVGGTPAKLFVFEARVKARTGAYPITYTRASFWGDAPAGKGALMVASEHTPPVLPSKYTAWSIQQHAQSSVPGVTGNVDRDQFNGTLELLSTFLQGIQATLIPSPPSDTMYTTEAGLRVRSAPSLTASVLRVISKAGTALIVEQVEVDGSGIKWRKLVNEDAYCARAYLTSTPPGAGTTTNPKASARPGIHIKAGNGKTDLFLSAAEKLHAAGKPFGCAVVVDNPTFANELALYTSVVFRNYVAGKDANGAACTSPAAARSEADRVYANHEGWMNATPRVRWYQFHNEDFVNIDFEMQTAKRAESDGRKVAHFGYNTTFPTNSVWNSLEPVLANAVVHGHCVVLHQYGPQDPPGHDTNLPISGDVPPGNRPWYGWHHRTLYALPGIPQPLLVIGETGYSNSVYGSAANLNADMLAYHQQLRADPYVLGACPYTFGSDADYELTGFLDQYVEMCLAF